MKNWNSILAPPWRPKPPASESSIGALQAAVSFLLSDEYKDLLLWANGGEGRIGEVYLSIWSVEDVVQLNEGYLIRENLPTVLVFGDDSANFYAFDYARQNPEVVRFPTGFVHPSGVNTRESSLEMLLHGLAMKRLY
jgi:hypothetical protein